jgi:short-subunit dehydrogenase
MIVWVTGGGTGIGKALAGILSREGHRVAISGRRADVLQEAAKSIGGEVLPLPGDMGHQADVNRIAGEIRSRWGEVDWLINNAGMNTNHSFQQASPEEYTESFRINCLSAILCARAVLPAMLARRSGSIVNVSSVLGRWASPDSSAYSTSKYALAGFTEALRQELAAMGVHVMGVYPGYIRTAMTQPFVKPGSPRDWAGKSPESMAWQILKGIRRKSREVQYPWYVPPARHLYIWFPGVMEALRRRFGR